MDISLNDLTWHVLHRDKSMAYLSPKEGQPQLQDLSGNVSDYEGGSRGFE